MRDDFYLKITDSWLRHKRWFMSTDRGNLDEISAEDTFTSGWVDLCNEILFIAIQLANKRDINHDFNSHEWENADVKWYLLSHFTTNCICCCCCHARSVSSTFLPSSCSLRTLRTRALSKYIKAKLVQESSLN